ncbi:14475_t:CDS:2, partial [Entrophospora sp. SA101]
MVNSDYETDSELEEKEISEVDSKSESEEEINVEFAAYFYNNNYKPKDLNKVNLEEKREESQRNTIKELDISYKDLTDSLDLSDFVNLERLDCSYNRLVGSLQSLQNLTKLKYLDIRDTDIDSVKLRQFYLPSKKLKNKPASPTTNSTSPKTTIPIPRTRETNQLPRTSCPRINSTNKTTKTKNHSRLFKQCQRIEDELEEKLGEEFVEKIQFILSDCE